MAPRDVEESRKIYLKGEGIAEAAVDRQREKEDMAVVRMRIGGRDMEGRKSVGVENDSG